MQSIEPAATAPNPAVGQPRLSALKRLVIWTLFLLLIYVTRDFFFLAFMTFMFSYMALALTGWIMHRIAPTQEHPGLRRLVTLGLFVLAPLVLTGIGAWVAPKFIAEGQKFAGWLSHVSPEGEISRQLERYVGPSEFRHKYGDPDDPRFKAGLEEFRKTGERHVEAYLQFSTLESWIEGGYKRQFTEAETARIRSHLLSEGTSSREFEQWFLTVKFPDLHSRSAHELADKGPLALTADPLVRMAATTKPPDMLQQLRRDPAALAKLRDEWIQDSVVKSLTAARSSPAYQAQFRAYYEDQKQRTPSITPYTFEQFRDLQNVRPQGPKAFGDELEKQHPSSEGRSAAQLVADFEAAQKHDLFQTWWSTNASAKFVQNEIATRLSGNSSGFVERALTALLNVPVDLMTALLLSFFICIDFPRMRRAAGRLRNSSLRDVHAEMAPALTSLAHLVGRSMQAQGIISACNATIIFLALTVLGVEHAMLLSGVVFVLCLVPTLGMIIAWVLLVAVAFAQPGGGLGLALKVTGAVVLVVILETFVFSPRILGKLMELHPVLIIAILPIAHYFFGVWGLILAVPVTVFLIQDVILAGRTTEDVSATEAHGGGALERPH